MNSLFTWKIATVNVTAVATCIVVYVTSEAGNFSDELSLKEDPSLWSNTTFPVMRHTMAKVPMSKEKELYYNLFGSI